MKFLKGTFYSLQQLATGATVFILSVFILQACKKDRPTNGPSIEKNLVITFGNGTIPIAQVDSANIILKKQGSNTPIFRRFDKGANSLNLLMDDTQTGNWTAEISIYTKKGTDNSSRLFTRSIGFSLPLASNFNLTGPTGEIGGVWEPHIVLTSDNHDVVAVLAADNAQPYFDIRVKDSKWDYFYIERYAFYHHGNMNEQVAAGAWECYSSCYTSDKLIVNTTGFLNFSNEVRTKNWNNAEIFIIVADVESGQERSFFYRYDKE